jgi:hypothetical protein
MRTTILMFSLVFTSLLGCAAEPVTSEGAEFATESGELRGGCRVVCPRCRPGQPCPRIACYMECHGRGSEREQCGGTLCPSGQVCCNSSCGICTDPGGFCIQLACEPTGGGCTTDADCRTFSNYCDGCACDALGTGDADPVCGGTTVSCFADPCMNVEARCDTATGACTLVDAAPTL